MFLWHCVWIDRTGHFIISFVGNVCALKHIRLARRRSPH